MEETSNHQIIIKHPIKIVDELFDSFTSEGLEISFETYVSQHFLSEIKNSCIEVSNYHFHNQYIDINCVGSLFKLIS